MMARRGGIGWSAALVVCAALLSPRGARADGWSLQLEPGYNAGTTEIAGAGGGEIRTDQTAFIHRYRLSLDKLLYPYVGLSGTGQWEQTLASSTVEDRTTDSDSRRWSAAARLTLGPPVLGGSVSYSRRQSETDTETTGFLAPLDTPALISETYSANLGWRPAEAPSFDLVLIRSENRDAERATQDQVSTEVGLSAIYREVEHFDFRGVVRYANPVDRLRGTESQELSESGSVAWNDRFLDRRVSASAGYTLLHRNSEVTASRANAEILTQQVPFEGYSLVEPTISLPTAVTLVVNHALLDGDVEGSAGLDIGPSVRLSGDTRLRDMGVQFSDPRTPVNVIHVYVDRQLPLAVWSAFVWSAYASDDNVTWTQVAVDRVGIRFGVFDNRFEIPIARTEARYLKLVVAPLLPGVTTSPELQSILVTELRTYLSQAAAQTEATSSSTSGALTGSVRALIERSYNLAYDGGVFFRHGADESWSTVSGLSATRRIGRVSSWGARVDRTDSGDLEGSHTAQSRASLSLSSDPLPTLGGMLTGGASLTESREGTAWAASTSALARADIYTGVSLSANAGAGLAEDVAGRQSRSASFATTATVTPHQTATLNGSYALQLSRLEGAAGWDRRSRVEGSAVFTPFPALSLSGAVARSFEGERPTTLATFSVNASPLQGGQLVLRFGYTETLDTATDSRTRQWGPGLRFTIRPGSHLDVGYSALTTRTGALETDSRQFFANLVITLR
jgi:hypothetical protein